MPDAPIKRLKDLGVPLGARICFRLQWVPFLTMSVLLICTLPFVLVWGLFHHSAEDFMHGIEDVFRQRVQRIQEHRARVIRLYAPATNNKEPHNG